MNRFSSLALRRTTTLSRHSWRAFSQTGKPESKDSTDASDATTKQSAPEPAQDATKSAQDAPESESAQDATDDKKPEEKPSGTAADFMAQAKKLLRGPFADLHDSAKVGTKVFPTDQSIIPVEQATPFSIQFDSVDGRRVSVPIGNNSVTVLLITFNQLGLDMVRQWRKILQADYGKDHFSHNVSSKRRKKPVHVLELSVVEGWVFSFLKSSVKQAYKSTLDDPSLYTDSGVWFGSFEEQKQQLGIENKAVGYVFVIDANGRVRWRAAGNAVIEDQAKLEMVLDQLTEK